jgi:hypothetical protein
VTAVAAERADFHGTGAAFLEIHSRKPVPCVPAFSVPRDSVSYKPETAIATPAALLRSPENVKPGLSGFLPAALAP